MNHLKIFKKNIKSKKYYKFICDGIACTSDNCPLKEKCKQNESEYYNKYSGIDLLLYDDELYSTRNNIILEYVKMQDNLKRW